MFTHFSNAISKKDTDIQFNRFNEVVNYLEKNNYSVNLKHVCASTSFLKYPNMMLDAVRLRLNYSRKNFSRKR